MRLFLIPLLLSLLIAPALPALADTMRTQSGSGTVTDIEPRPDGARLTLSPHDFGYSGAVRLTVKTDTLPRLYDTVTLTGRLGTPPAPAAPGAFDARAYLADIKGIEAIGFSYGAPTVIPEDSLPWYQGVERGLMATRLALTAFFMQASPDDPASGALAAAFVTGQRGYIPDAVNDAYRASGLYHYLSISGTHMTLVIGVVFLLLRLGLLFFMTAPHKAAAWGAMLAATAYVALAGFEIPAVRAWLMGALVMLAVILDRRVLSLWTLALAAAGILLIAPNAVLSPSFQLSFLAVLTLLLTARALSAWLWLRQGGEVWRIAKITVCGFLATTISISLATAPLTAFYFQQVQLYAVVANALAAPLSGFVIMPFLALASVVQTEWAAAPALWGLRQMTTLAETIAAWPQATQSVPPFPGWCVPVLLGLLALLFYQRRRWVKLCALLCLSGLAWLIAHQPPPDILISADGRSVVLVQQQALTVLSYSRAPRALRDWQRLYGASGATILRPGDKNAPGCDAAACLVYLVVPSGVYSVALAAQPASLPDMCKRADIVLSSVAPPPGCGRLLAVSGDYLAAHGALALRFDKKGALEILDSTASLTLRLPYVD